MPTRTLFSAFSLTVALTIAHGGQAQAAPPDEEVSAHVSYRGLDLSAPDDARTLLSRIRAAARTVCQSDNGFTEQIDRSYRRAPCAEATIAEAVADLNNPMVTAAYRSRTARSTAFATNVH